MSTEGKTASWVGVMLVALAVMIVVNLYTYRAEPRRPVDAERSTSTPPATAPVAQSRTIAQAVGACGGAI